MNKNSTIAIMASLCILSGCTSPRTVIERQAEAAGSTAERAVLAKFPETTPESLHWATVFWYCSRRTETNHPSVDATVELIDTRTLRRDSYSYPDVKRFKVEIGPQNQIRSVERDTDGVLNLEPERRPSKEIHRIR
jgi:hypothetical protein